MKPVIKAAKKQEDPFEKYRESMYIDKHRLDEAMVTQPVFYQEVSEGYVHAKSLADASKAEMERLDAMIAAELRITWARTGEKSSETRVGDEVIRDPRHVEAFKQYQQLVKQAASYAALQASFDQRGKMLRELSSLFVAGYFSQVEVRGTGNSVRDGKAALVRETLKQRRNSGAQ